MSYRIVWKANRKGVPSQFGLKFATKEKAKRKINSMINSNKMTAVKRR